MINHAPAATDVRAAALLWDCGVRDAAVGAAAVGAAVRVRSV